MIFTFKTLRTALIAGSITLLGATAASATPWQQNHPRRVEVNQRLAHQNQRIYHGLLKGDRSLKDARQLHREDRFVRREERFMAAQHNGHITRAEQRSLNQQENGVSREIGK